MNELPTWVHVAALCVVMACWFGFAGVFLFRKRPAKSEAKRRESFSLFGIVVQGLGYSLVWMLQRRHFTPIVRLPGLAAAIPPLLACALAIGSLVMVMSALATLGKEWSLEARLIEGHRLVTSGPFGIVRHPIYAAMLGYLIATGLVISHWIGLVAGIVVLSIGTAIRTRSEERLLRSQFGAEYEAYARRVPGIVPLPWR